MVKYKNKKLLLELIKAELINNCGYLTELAMKVSPIKYHTIQKIFSGRVKFDYIAIQIEIITFILKCFNIQKVIIPIDDTIVYRSRKKKVPNGHKQYDHSLKPNKANYVFGQRWLAFGLIIEIKKIRVSLPLFVYLVNPEDNLISVSANVLLKINSIMKRKGLKLKVDVITDSWFAKNRLLLKIKHSCKFNFITMCRVDSAMYELPPQPKKRQKGRPKKRGEKISVKLEDLDKEAILQLYSKRDVKVRYKEKIVKVRFLDYEIVKAVWVEFDNNGSMRLIISSDTNLLATQIIEQYSKRWDIEVMFNELKNGFRFKDNMLHSVKSYNRFLYFKIYSYIIIKLTLLNHKKSIVEYIKKFLPWRVDYKKGVIVTTNSAKLALSGFFSSLEMKDFLPKVQKNKSHKPVNNDFMGVYLNLDYRKTG